MTGHGGLLAAAWRRVRTPVLLPLVGGNLLLLFAAAFALLIPDSHAWQLLLSFLLAIGIVSGLLLWNATALRRLRQPVEAVPLWTGALLLGGLLVLGALLWHLAGLAEPGVETRAGYWNSQMSAGLRHLLSYPRLVLLQNAAIDVFQWVLLPAILVPFAIEMASFGLRAAPLGRALRVVFSLRHWAVALVALGIVAWTIPALASWHPAHSVRGETISAVLRLGCAALLAVAAVVTLLAVDAELLHRCDRAESRRL